MGPEGMREEFIKIIRNGERAGSRAVTLLSRLISAVSRQERAFRRIWPEVNEIEGFLVSPHQERWLFQTAQSLPDWAVIVEIGSFKGRSTCCLAFGCLGTRKHIFAIDTFAGNLFDAFMENVRRRGLGEYVTPVVGLSSEVAKKWDKPVYMLFIDGSHEYEGVLADFHGFFPYVVPGGIVALHDVVETWPGPLRAWHNVIKYALLDVGMCSTLAYGIKPK